MAYKIKKYLYIFLIIGLTSPGYTEEVTGYNDFSLDLKNSSNEFINTFKNNCKIIKETTNFHTGMRGELYDLMILKTIKHTDEWFNDIEPLKGKITKVSPTGEILKTIVFGYDCYSQDNKDMVDIAYTVEDGHSVIQVSLGKTLNDPTLQQIKNKLESKYNLIGSIEYVKETIYGYIYTNKWIFGSGQVNLYSGDNFVDTEITYMDRTLGEKFLVDFGFKPENIEENKNFDF